MGRLMKRFGREKPAFRPSVGGARDEGRAMSERPNASAASGLKLAPRPGRAPCDAWTPRARREPRARRAKCGRKHVNFREARQVSGAHRGRFVYPLQMRKKGKTLSSVFDSVSTARFERAFHRRFPFSSVEVKPVATRGRPRSALGAPARIQRATLGSPSPRPLSVVVALRRAARKVVNRRTRGAYSAEEEGRVASERVEALARASRSGRRGRVARGRVDSASDEARGIFLDCREHPYWGGTRASARSRLGRTPWGTNAMSSSPRSSPSPSAPISPPKRRPRA